MPTDPKLEGKLTPAAKQLLDEVVDDYRTQLLVGAGESASSLGDVREVSVHDVLAGLGRQQSRFLAAPRSGFERFLSLYVSVGLALGAMGFLAFIVRDLLIGRRFEEQLPLLVALAGFSMSALSYLLLRARSIRVSDSWGRDSGGQEPHSQVGPYLSQWAEIEVALRSLTAMRFGESAANAPASKLAERLASEGLLSTDDLEKLRGLLALRNTVAHGHGSPVPPAELRGTIRDGARILEQLRRLS